MIRHPTTAIGFSRFEFVFVFRLDIPGIEYQNELNIEARIYDKVVIVFYFYCHYLATARPTHKTLKRQQQQQE